MALTATQKRVGTQRSKSPADEVKRSGRDSGVRTPAKGFTEKGKSPAESVSRTGRSTPTGTAPNKGIGRGSADSGSGNVARLKGDGVGGPLPSA